MFIDYLSHSTTNDVTTLSELRTLILPKQANFVSTATATTARTIWRTKKRGRDRLNNAEIGIRTHFIRKSARVKPMATKQDDTPKDAIASKLIIPDVIQS